MPGMPNPPDTPGIPGVAGMGGILACLDAWHALRTAIRVEKEKEKCWTFSLNVGDCYILSGDARNVCDHGVLCVGGGRRSHKVDAARESLNLRFGLHSPQFADQEVYWQFPSFSSTLQAAAQAAQTEPAPKGRRRRR